MRPSERRAHPNHPPPADGWTRSADRKQRREGTVHGDPRTLVKCEEGTRTASQPDDDRTRDQADRMTRISCQQGEDSEGWSATGEGSTPATARPTRPGQITVSPQQMVREGSRKWNPKGSQDRPRPKQRESRAGVTGPAAATKSQKLGEPHDRFQGAKNLRGTMRSKPSKPGGTARTERIRKVAASNRR